MNVHSSRPFRRSFPLLRPPQSTVKPYQRHQTMNRLPHPSSALLRCTDDSPPPPPPPPPLAFFLPACSSHFRLTGLPPFSYNYCRPFRAGRIIVKDLGKPNDRLFPSSRHLLRILYPSSFLFVASSTHAEAVRFLRIFLFSSVQTVCSPTSPSLRPLFFFPPTWFQQLAAPSGTLPCRFRPDFHVMARWPFTLCALEESGTAAISFPPWFRIFVSWRVYFLGAAGKTTFPPPHAAIFSFFASSTL